MVGAKPESHPPLVIRKSSAFLFCRFPVTPIASLSFGSWKLQPQLKVRTCLSFPSNIIIRNVHPARQITLNRSYFFRNRVFSLVGHGSCNLDHAEQQSEDQN